MADENGTGSKWWLTVLIVPLLVGVVLAVWEFALPSLLGPRNELSFTVEASQSIEGLKLNIENVPIGALYVYKVRLWNSGGNALKSLPVLLRFDSSPGDFKILNTNHTTKPAYEFGAIQEEQPDQISRKFTYILLNKDDEDQITFLTNRPGNLGVFAKSENLRVKAVSPTAESRWERYYSVIAVIGGMMISFFSLTFQRFFQKKISKPGLISDYKAR